MLSLLSPLPTDRLHAVVSAHLRLIKGLQKTESGGADLTKILKLLRICLRDVERKLEMREQLWRTQHDAKTEARTLLEIPLSNNLLDDMARADKAINRFNHIHPLRGVDGQ